MASKISLPREELTKIVNWEETAKTYEQLFNSLSTWAERVSDENLTLRHELSAVLARLARYERGGVA